MTGKVKEKKSKQARKHIKLINEIDEEIDEDDVLSDECTGSENGEDSDGYYSEFNPSGEEDPANVRYYYSLEDDEEEETFF